MDSCKDKCNNWYLAYLHGRGNKSIFSHKYQEMIIFSLHVTFFVVVIVKVQDQLEIVYFLKIKNKTNN